jgi:hypothetical protein
MKEETNKTAKSQKQRPSQASIFPPENHCSEQYGFKANPCLSLQQNFFLHSKMNSQSYTQK